MRLKKLEINGFKSFAEKIALNFDADLIGLVGPNGCGKSNIVDAILWVLGEQSARSMRAEKMHDVLFAGTEDVKPTNFAEVTLFLEKEEDDFSITRRLYRDGETCYLINRKEARLKDVHDLFLGTGVGKHALFVFEQGKIDEIINLSPEKRRSIFEETAGISRFLLKKKEASSELNQLENNFLRLNDLHSEREKHVKSLQRQATKAKHYKENKLLLEKLEQAILFYKIDELINKIEEESASQKSCLEASLEVERKISFFEKQLHQSKEIEEEKNRERNELHKELSNITSSLKILDLKLKNNHETCSHYEGREKRALAEREKLLSKREEKTVSIIEKKKGLEALEKERKSFEIENEKASRLLEALKKTISDIEIDEKRVHKELVEVITAENSCSSKVQEKELKKEAKMASCSKNGKKIDEVHKEICSLEAATAEKRKEIEVITAEMEKESLSLKSHEKAGLELSSCLQKKEKEKESLSLKLSEKVAHEKALLKLQEEHAGFSNAAKLLLKESKDPKSPLYKKVVELFKCIRCEPDHENLLALAFKNYEETLLVKEKSDLAEIFQWASQKKMGEFSLLLQEDLENITLLLAKPSFSTLEEALLARKERQEESFVASEALFIDRHGVIFYRGEKEKSVFIRLSELKKMRDEIVLLDTQLKKCEEEIELLIHDKKLWEATRSSLDEKRRKREMTLLQENFFLQRTMEDLKAKQSEVSKLKKENEKDELLLAQLEKESVAIVNTLTQVREQKKRIQEKQAALEQNSHVERENLERSMALHLHNRKRWDALLHNHRQWKEELTVLELREEEEKREQLRLSQEIEECSALRKGEHGKGQAWELEKEELLRKKNELEIRERVFIEEGKKEKSEKKEIENELALLRKRMREIEKQQSVIELLLAEKKGALHLLQSDIEQKFGNREKVTLDLSLKEAEEKVVRLKIDLENEKAINLASIEEFEEEEKKFIDLDLQLKDLKGGREELGKLIQKLEKESKKLLKATFEQVRVNFKKNFKILFQGGDADLKFTSEQDILESGVEIIAKPPSKKMRSLTLLSGGEKCLTTLALLFALFEVKPAPFCILDEVDAPLDDANVERFTNLLKEFSTTTQFITVTHNKKTMASCDTLMGVSMEKRGISQLVTLALTKKVTTMENTTC